MDTIRRAPRGTALFYVLTITTAFGSLENITEETTTPLSERGIITCDDNEYLVSNRCCQKCPAGTRVSISCSVNHGLGDCRNCTTGKDFTEFPNGLNTCLPCRACRGDEVLVEECTLTRNTLCKCKPGTYLCQANMNCSNTGTCSTCSSCPEGQGIKDPCNATANTVCEDLVQMSNPNLHQIELIIGVSVAMAVLLLLIGSIICVYRHRRNRNEDHLDHLQTTINNVSNTESPDSEHSNGSSRRLINEKSSPDSEHSNRSSRRLINEKTDPNGSTTPISEDLKNSSNSNGPPRINGKKHLQLLSQLTYLFMQAHKIKTAEVIKYHQRNKGRQFGLGATSQNLLVRIVPFRIIIHEITGNRQDLQKSNMVPDSWYSMPAIGHS